MNEYIEMSICGTPLEIASYKNHKEAIFLISVLDEPDLLNRIITKAAGEECCKTIIGYPILAKLLKDINGKPYDFGGHEVKIKKDRNGKKQIIYDTFPVGGVIDAWVESREVPGYKGTKDCILIKTKLWHTRYPEYFEVFDKLWESGNLSTSWELTASLQEKKNQYKIIKKFELVGNVLLGTKHIGAVPSAGVLECAELNLDDITLSNALTADINTKFNNCVLKKEENGVMGNNETDSGGTMDNASLTSNDLRRKIERAIYDKIGEWCWIFLFFPEERKVWVECSERKSELDYKMFTYQVTNDEVEISEPEDVKLCVSVSEINTKVAEMDKDLEEANKDILLKSSAIVKANEKIKSLEKEVAALKPYKEKVEIAEKAQREHEIAEKKKELKAKLLKSNLFKKAELEENDEIKSLINEVDEDGIDKVIATRYMASLENSKDVLIASATSLSLEDEDDNDELNPRSIMKRILS